MARYDDQFMRHTDALAWNMEHDPGLRSTIVGVTWLDARPALEVLTARLDRATRIAPRFRQRPVRPPGLFATPRWVDCDLDLSIHLRRIDAPHPHTPRTVVEFARSEAMTEFDPSRPLWAMTLIEGLEGDRAALVLKLHHSLTDGLGAVQLGYLLFELVPEPEPVVPVEDVGPEPVGRTQVAGVDGHRVVERHQGLGGGHLGHGPPHRTGIPLAGGDRRGSGPEGT